MCVPFTKREVDLLLVDLYHSWKLLHFHGGVNTSTLNVELSCFKLWLLKKKVCSQRYFSQKEPYTSVFVKIFSFCSLSFLPLFSADCIHSAFKTSSKYPLFGKLPCKISMIQETQLYCFIRHQI